MSKTPLTHIYKHFHPIPGCVKLRSRTQARTGKHLNPALPSSCYGYIHGWLVTLAHDGLMISRCRFMHCYCPKPLKNLHVLKSPGMRRTSKNKLQQTDRNFSTALETVKINRNHSKQRNVRNAQPTGTLFRATVTQVNLAYPMPSRNLHIFRAADHSLWRV